MKQSILLLLFLVGLLSGIQAEKLYKVIKVKGTISLESSGKTLAAKSQFSEEDTLNFSSIDDRLAIIDQKQLAYIVIPKPDLKSYSLKPIQQRINTRPGKSLNKTSFKEYIENQDILVLGRERLLPVPVQDFPLGEQQYFFIRYALQGDSRPVNKKLAVRGESMVINKAELFTVAGKQIDPALTSNFQLFYNDALRNFSEEIAPISLIFPNESSLKEELNEIRPKKKLNQRQFQSYSQFVENYLLEFYGHIEGKDIEAWLKN